jgi:hypothetical protein
MTKDQIKMYNHPKIQEGWKPEVGDRVACDDFPDKGKTFVIIRRGDHSSGNYWIVSDGRIIHAEYHISQLIFLPSIEQMAEMWHEGKDDKEIGKDGLWPRNSGFRFTVNLHAFLKDSEFKPDLPLHIIVLAFIMSDLHGKTWDDEKGWV